MTYTPTQIEVIKVFGRKELSFGCIVGKGDYILTKWYTCSDNSNIYYLGERLDNGKFKYKGTENEKDIKILGHLPTLESLFIKAEEKGITIRIDNETLLIITTKPVLNVIEIPYNPTLPLIDQEEEALASLLNLFK